MDVGGDRRLAPKMSPTSAAVSTAFRGSSARSQSSVQLLGFIENCLRVDVTETTDEGELRVKGYETLLAASTSVLSCIQVARVGLCVAVVGRR